jgi:hypothetical protein
LSISVLPPIVQISAANDRGAEEDLKPTEKVFWSGSRPNGKSIQGAGSAPKPENKNESNDERQ